MQRTYANRGVAHYERAEPGDLEAAIDDLSRAIELDDSLFRAYYNRALARIRLGRSGLAGGFGTGAGPVAGFCQRLQRPLLGQHA